MKENEPSPKETLMEKINIVMSLLFMGSLVVAGTIMIWKYLFVPPEKVVNVKFDKAWVDSAGVGHYVVTNWHEERWDSVNNCGMFIVYSDTLRLTEAVSVDSIITWLNDTNKTN